MRKAIDIDRRGADSFPSGMSGSLLKDIADATYSMDELAAEGIIHFRA
jgi:hypothetical protein